MEMAIDQDNWVVWDSFLSDNNLSIQKEFIDLTSGYEVKATIDGNSALPWVASGINNSADNTNALKGLYAPDLNLIHLIGIIDLDADWAIDEDGQTTNAVCKTSSAGQKLCYQNLFGRKVRRQLEFFGVFDEGSGRVHGQYREKISGLASDFVMTLQGDFIQEQSSPDEPTVIVPDVLMALEVCETGDPTSTGISYTDSCAATLDPTASGNAAYTKHKFSHFQPCSKNVKKSSFGTSFCHKFGDRNWKSASWKATKKSTNKPSLASSSSCLDRNSSSN